MANWKDERSALPTGRRREKYPMHQLRRVTEPTTRIAGDVPRPDEREHGFAHAMRGDYGPAAQRGMMRFIGKYPLSAALASSMTTMVDTRDGQVAPSKAPLPDDPRLITDHIKSAGCFLKADIVGVCELPRYAVYSHNGRGEPVELNHKYAIVLVVDQDFETMAGSTGDDWISGSQSMVGYANAALMACQLADYIRRLGYPARAHHARGYDVVLPPLLLNAGIGEMSRAGIVLNPFIGMRFKASAVTTDLPLVPDSPVDFGLQAFCDKCLKCAAECHSGAITKGGKVLRNGYETWRFDAEQCAKFRVTNPHGNACGRCIKVCPYNKPAGWTHDAVRWSIQHLPFLDGVIARMDDLLHYGRQEKEFKWWFDLEDVEGDGRLSVPKRSQNGAAVPPPD